MPHCVTCGSHYFKSPYNESLQCDNCTDVLDDSDMLYLDDPDAAIEIDHVVNPSGRVKAHIYDENDNDTESFSI